MVRCEPSPPNSGAKTGPQFAEADVGDSFSKCMSWVGDYDEEWTEFVHEHDLKMGKSRPEEIESESLPRVWNLPHE
jgi:hypothetical protein